MASGGVERAFCPYCNAQGFRSTSARNIHVDACRKQAEAELDAWYADLDAMEASAVPRAFFPNGGRAILAVAR